MINKEEKDKGEGEEEREENLGTSKFEAALKDLEALGRGQGTRWEAVPQPRVWSAAAEEGVGEDRAKQKRSSGDFFDRKKTTCMLYLQVRWIAQSKCSKS